MFVDFYLGKQEIGDCRSGWAEGVALVYEVFEVCGGVNSARWTTLVSSLSCLFGSEWWKLNVMIIRDILVEMSTQGQLPLPYPVSIAEAQVAWGMRLICLGLGLYAYAAPNEFAERPAGATQDAGPIPR